jgi:enoyl-CoA hydratase/carnithine racemase
MKSDFGTLTITQDDGVVEVILNRPKVRNAISHQMQAEIDVALDEAEVDPGVKAVVLRGEGAIFSAGHDLKEQMAGKSFPALTFPFASPSISPRLPRAWYFRKPLIGAVHGYVGPYAIALVACCDFNIAAEHTRFSCEVFRSSYPDVGWLPLYMQLPMRVIEKLWLMGGWMDAEQALAFQFVQRVLPQEDVTGEALRWARQAAQISPEAFAHSKEKIRRSIEVLGLSSLHTVLSQYGPPHDSRQDSGAAPFGNVLQEQGLKEAVRLRDQKFDPDITRV